MLASYQEAEEYLLDIPKFSSKNRVEDTVSYLEVLGSPEKEQKIIHVAGTNGKGSVCAYLCSILMEAGYSVGMFTSPHLVEIRERFRIDGIPVSEEDFITAFVTVMERLEQARKKIGKDNYHPTFFELLFLMGMVVFQNKKPDYLLLETGMGGRLDATNAVSNPVLTVITQIGMDHMEYLGETVEKIAGEKAGIIKPGVPVVYCDKKTEASQVIKKKAESLGNRAVGVKSSDIFNMNLRNKSIDFSISSRYYGYIALKVKTKALYQTENAAIAVRCMEELPERTNVTAEQIRRGVEKARWEGRMEEVLPGVYLDGAHNEDGIHAFCHTVKADGCKGERFLIFAAVADKNFEAMIDRLRESQLFSRVVIPCLVNKRAAKPGKLEQKFTEGNGGRKECLLVQDTKEALEYLLSGKKDEDIIYAAGSLYLVGEIKALLRRRSCD
ncbi:MAG: bifunctional folylpolyglutamate synthase/dihydrofolate synthase [Lachnospiraceae bacterium]|nr:bifunctional folylpolyglutamate synthase/dihydrofolate synthase [Lachnospiraceae bacterium]